MESDHSELFNTEALSFDSTLDSLMDVDYIPDEKVLPFSPPSFNASSEVPMSSRNELREDLGNIDEDGVKNIDSVATLEHVLIKEVVETQASHMEKIKESRGSKRNVDDDFKSKVIDIKESYKEDDEAIQINIEITERTEKEIDSSEPSLNIDQIKAKRRKNLERKNPKTNNESSSRTKNDVVKGSVSKCPIEHLENKSESKRIEKEEAVKEPPHKKMKISSKEFEKLEKVPIDTGINDSDKNGKVFPKADEKQGNIMETIQVGEKINKVSIREKDRVELNNEVMVSNNSSVDKKVDTDNGAGENEVSDKENDANFIGIVPKEGDDSDSRQEFDNGIDQLNEQVGDDQITNEMKEEKFGDEDVEVEPGRYVTESESELENLYNEAIAIDYDLKETDGDDENNEDDSEDYPGELEKGEEAGDEENDEFDDDDDDDDVNDDEIHNWLDEGLTKEEIKEKQKADLKYGEYIANEKYILEEKGVNPFEVLPAGWIVISHNSGMPVYLHKETRVCTFSRPYNIGAGSSRAHEIPLSTIPCLQYRRQLEKEKLEESQAAEKMTNGQVKVETKSEEISDLEAMPKPVIKRADDTDKIITLAPNELNEYCRGLFNFRTVTVKKFKTWREKRAHLVEERKKKAANMPTLAPETKLITCPIPPEFLNKKSRKKEFVLNPEGKTAVSILHEYTQNVLRVQPTYEFKEMSNADLPFKATVCLNGMEYGSGVATGKRQAKNEGAKATLEILVPELAELWNEKNPSSKQKNELGSDIKFFEQVAIEDPRVPELCVKSSLPQPYQVLHTCLQRNYGLGDTTFKVEKKMITNQKTEFTLSVGKRTCTVVCKNKREAKQKAAQTMLQQLHPLLKNWASILRLYSKNTEVGFEEQKDEFPEQTVQQEKKKNFEILAQLKGAMRKVREQRKNFADGSQVTNSGQTPATLDL